MSQDDQEQDLLRSVALQNAASILRARRRAEDDLFEAREELRRSHERLRATFEQAAVGIATADIDGRFIETNPKFCALTGYSAEELRQLTFRDITHADDLEETDERVRRLLSGEIGDYSVEKRYRRRDGSVFWGLTTVTLMRAGEGVSERFIGVVEDITTRKEAVDAFHRSEQFNRRIIESSSDCIKTLSLDGVVTWISDSGCRALRIDSPERVVGQVWPDIWLPGDCERARQALLEAAAGGVGRFSGMFPVGGEPRWWSVLITPILDANGRPESLLAVSRDETPRRLSEGAAAEREEQLRQLANSIPQLAWMAGPGGDVFWFNERWYVYTGTTPEQMMGWGWKSVHDPEIVETVMERWMRSIATGEPFEMEFPIRGADGQFRWFLTRVEPIRDAQGRVTRWFGTNTDIDELRRTRQALEEETRVLEILNQTGQTLASSLDLQTVLQKVTDWATQLSGAQFGAFFYNRVNAAGESYMLYTLSGAPSEAFSKFRMPRNTPVFGPTFRGEGIVRSADITRDPRYGTMAPHHGMPEGHLPVRSYLAVPVVSRSGEVLGGLFFGHSAVGVFTQRAERLVAGIAGQAAVAMDNARLFEETQRAAAERERLLDSEREARADAEHASRTKDDFLATLSHELRTPLSSILGWSNLLRSRNPAPEELSKGLEIIERNARLQTQLIEDLLDMSRITSGTLRMDVQPVQPVTFVQAALEIVRPAAEAKGVRLISTLDPDAGPVSGDPARLQQIVWNLAHNAIKFTDRGGKVQVVLERVNSHIEIRVADTGIGIEAQFLPYVFERFRQADASSTRRFGGLGLGLSIVKQLVELHGGRVRAESAGADRGANFIVELPLSIAHQLPVAHPREHPRARPLEVAEAFARVDLKGVRALVVDDQADACELAARVLQECGAEVVTVLAASQALERLHRERFDVLLSDIGMPGMDGYALVRSLRELPPSQGGRTPAIAMTAFARSEDRTRALRSGFQVHVAKPVEPSELAATVASVVQR